MKKTEQIRRKNNKIINSEFRKIESEDIIKSNQIKVVITPIKENKKRKEMIKIAKRIMKDFEDEYYEDRDGGLLY